MNQPLNQTSNISSTVFQQLPPEFEALAISTKALQRCRQVKNATELLHLVFMYSWLGLSSAVVAARFSCLYRRITDWGVLCRLAGCGDYLKQLICQQLEVGSEQLGQLSERYLITIVDGSSWGARGGKSSDYRLHLKLGLQMGQWLAMLLGDNHLCESLLNYTYQVNELVLADRNYGRTRALVKIDAHGVKFVVRGAPSQIRIMDADGEKLDWLQIVDEAEENQGRYERQVWINGVGKARARVRVILGKLPKDKGLIAQAKARRQARRRGGQIKAETLRFAQWVIVLSNLAGEEASVEQILELYRMRWQVEIGIKRLKSLYQIDQMRSGAKSAVGQVRILGKLLMVLMIQQKLKIICAASSKVKRILNEESSGWREHIWQRKEMEQIIWGEVDEKEFEKAVERMKQRKRKYQLQSHRNQKGNGERRIGDIPRLLHPQELLA